MARGSTDDNDKSTTGQAYEIIKADSNLSALEVDGKTLRFPRVNKSLMRTRDRGLAMSIRDQYGKGRNPQVTVTKVAYPDPADRGHKYSFVVPTLPWHRREQDGKAENEEKETAEREGSNGVRRGDCIGTSPNEEEKAR